MQCVEELSPEALCDLDEIESLPAFDVPGFPATAFIFTETTTSATACTYSVTVPNLEAYDGVLCYAQSPFGLTTDHTGQAWRGWKEFLDILEIDLSFGLQAGGKVKVLCLGELGVKLDYSSEHGVLKGGSPYQKTTQGGEIGIGFLKRWKGLGGSLEAYRERCGVAPQGGCPTEYLSGAPWKLEPSLYGFGYGRVAGNADLKIGGGAAVLFGAEGYLNVSEVWGFLKYLAGY
jgi:hypothetical protein